MPIKIIGMIGVAPPSSKASLHVIEGGLSPSYLTEFARGQGNRLTGDSYTRSGGVREAIRITAERTFDALSPADQQVARQLFLRLVTPGEGQDTRARAAMPVDQASPQLQQQQATVA
jgi:hypothetical protein